MRMASNFPKIKLLECVLFCTKRKPNNDTCLHLNRNQINVVKEVKFLDVIFDNKLSFVQHIRML